MKIHHFLCAVICVFTFSVSALDRSIIAESASDVTPLLNGQTIPNVTLKTAGGAPVSLRAISMQKPTIILFYRGGWCPYCNNQLAELKNIESDLVDLGYQVLAISPESPDRLQEQKLETEFAVQLLSDDNLAAIKQFGIGFYLPLAKEKIYEIKKGIKLTDDQTNNRAVLPAPAVFIVDKKGLIKFNYVNPDFKVRLSAELLLQAAKLTL
jgi:peroxiredoxin